MAQTIAIERVDHIGIRVRDLDRALAFLPRARVHPGAQGRGGRPLFNVNAGDPDSNILMAVPDKFAGYTHVALRVASIPATIAESERYWDLTRAGQLWPKRASLGLRAGS